MIMFHGSMIFETRKIPLPTPGQQPVTMAVINESDTCEIY